LPDFSRLDLIFRNFGKANGGEGGIRTHDPGFSQDTAFRERGLQPLGHLSATTCLKDDSFYPLRPRPVKLPVTDGGLRPRQNSSCPPMRALRDLSLSPRTRLDSGPGLPDDVSGGWPAATRSCLRRLVHIGINMVIFLMAPQRTRRKWAPRHFVWVPGGLIGGGPKNSVPINPSDTLLEHVAPENRQEAKICRTSAWESLTAIRQPASDSDAPKVGRPIVLEQGTGF
jgi:hypothetical protein